MDGISIGELAEVVGGVVFGAGDTVITGAASVDEALPGDIVLAENEKYLETAEQSQASAVVCSNGACCRKPAIKVDDPRRAFAEILGRLAPQERRLKSGIDPSCRVGERVKCGDGASIGYGCFIGDDVTIGDGTVIHPLVYLGDKVHIGSQSVVYPNVTIYPGCEIGSKVIVHSGAVIGSDGFGYLRVGEQIHKVPQIGRVVIEDDVEIGANVTIDRAKTGATRIGRGTKIDNLVQVGHNVKIGKCCLLAAQVGLSGSSIVGDGVVFAGQVGVKDHVSIGDRVVIGGQAGVIGDLDAGGVYSGYPARPHKESLKAQAALLRLPETQRIIDNLRKEIERLSARLDQLEDGKV